MFLKKLSFSIVCVARRAAVNPRIPCRNYNNYNNLSYKHNVGAAPLQHIPFGAILDQAADKWPDRPAIISRQENKTITYSQLLKESDRVAAALLNIGLQPGDRVGIWLPNCTQWVVLMMAASRIGVISVAINHLYRHKEMEYALKKVGVKALFAPGSRLNKEFYSVLANIIPELTNSKPGDLRSEKFDMLQSVILVDDDDSPGTLNYDAFMNMASTQEVNAISGKVQLIDPDSGCNIQYTSGTTGNPKAAILTHNGIVNNGFYIGARNELNQGYKKICVQVPFFHVFGVVATIAAGLQHGATMVVPSPTYSPSANIEALLAEKCDVIHGTPTMHVDLVNRVMSKGIKGLNSEIVVTGGSPVTPKLVQDMANTLKVSKVKSIFGMTETTAVNFQSVPDEDPERPLNYVGLLHDHLEAKIVDDQNNLVPFGTPGELLIRGYSLMSGYWDDEEKTRENISPSGWLRTGDRVVLHEDGYGQIVGRLKDLIIRGGENIAPKEIEDVISTHPDILECQVFGITDERLGEEICATVRIREGAKFDEKSLQQLVEENLASYKVPRLFKRVDAFPKTASGKVQKFKLRDMVESGKL